MPIKDLLGLGTSLLGGAFSGIGANKRQKAAIKAQREENEKARNWQQKMAEWQVGIERENLADERAYNNPSAVMKRLKDAGLNPDLMYGNGASGLVDSNVADSASVGNVPPADVAGPIMGTPTMMESLFQGAAYAKTVAETKNIKADTSKKEGEVTSLNIDNFVKAASSDNAIKMSGLEVQLTKAQAEYTVEQKSKLISEINDINEHVNLLKAQISETWSRTANLDSATVLNRTTAILNNRRFDLECEEFARRVRETDAKVNLSEAEAKSILVTMYAKVNNINTDTALKQANIRLTDAQKTQVEHYTNSIDIHRDAAVFKLQQDQKYDDAQRIVAVANQATQSLYHISQVASDWLPSPGGIAKKLLRSGKK
nr:MAG TPA: DNA pilot protein VP2 [Microviridae sp.]